MIYREIAAALVEKGYAMAVAAIDMMMGLIEEETGIWPDWDETAPKWVIVSCGIGPQEPYF